MWPPYCAWCAFAGSPPEHALQLLGDLRSQPASDSQPSGLPRLSTAAALEALAQRLQHRQRAEQDRRVLMASLAAGTSASSRNQQRLQQQVAASASAAAVRAAAGAPVTDPELVGSPIEDEDLEEHVAETKSGVAAAAGAGAAAGSRAGAGAAAAASSSPYQAPESPAERAERLAAYRAAQCDFLADESFQVRRRCFRFLGCLALLSCASFRTAPHCAACVMGGLFFVVLQVSAATREAVLQLARAAQSKPELLSAATAAVSATEHKKQSNSVGAAAGAAAAADDVGWALPGSPSSSAGKRAASKSAQGTPQVALN